MSRIARRSMFGSTFLVILALLLAACGGGPGPASPTAVPAPGAATGTSAGGPTAGTATPGIARAAGAATAAVPPFAGPAPPMKNPNEIVNVVTDLSYNTLDPAFCYDTGCAGLILNVYEGLIYPKKETVDQFVPWLATKWDIADGGKTYTFTIRKGVKFQRGQDLTPEDVAYSLWRSMIQDASGGPTWLILQPLFGLDVQSFKDDIVTKQYKGDWAAACEAVKKTVTFDTAAGTVTLHLPRPYGPMLQILGGGFSGAVALSKSWVAGLGGWDGTCATVEKYHDPKAEDDELYKVMNGTGPYQLDHWTPAQELVITRNPNYWRTEPMWEGMPTRLARIERVVWRATKEWGTRLATLEAGDADYIDIPAQYRPQADALVKETCDFPAGSCTTTNPNGWLRLTRRIPVGNTAGAWFFNQQISTEGNNPWIGSGRLDGQGIPPDFFADIHVRKAFSYAYDAQTVIDQVLQGEGEPGVGLVIKGSLGYDPNQPRYTFDLAKAAAEFKAATLKSADGKSLWDTGFKFQWGYTEGAPHPVGDILNATLQKINPKFKLEMVAHTGNTVYKDWQAGRVPLWPSGWVEDFHDTHDWVYPYLGSGGFFASFQHFPKDLQTQFDTLISQGVQETDSTKRAQIYQQLNQMTYDNALDVFTANALGRNYDPVWIKGGLFGGGYYNPMVFWTYYYNLSKGQ